MSWRQGTHVSLKLCALIGIATLGLTLAACSGNWQRLLGDTEAEEAAPPEAVTAPQETTVQAGLDEVQEQLAAERAKLEQLQKKVRRLTRTLKQQISLRRNAESKLARSRLELFEREAHLNDLNDRLEEAILEVVRAKAKLRSLESKAEAASTLAEAEIALKALEDNSDGSVSRQLAKRATELLKLGAKEFKKENYGGSLYLTSQVKGLLGKGKERAGRGKKDYIPFPGEVTFDLPVPLSTKKQANLRANPGSKSKILLKLKSGASLVGYAYKGLWVRVASPDGRIGWVFHKLVGPR